MRHALLTLSRPVLLAIALTGCPQSPRGVSPPGGAPPPMPALELPVAKPGRSSIQRWVSLPAVAAPWQEVTLQSKISGYLDQIRVDKGDRVKTGDLIAEIAVPELRADLLKWEAETELAERDFQRVSAALERAADLVIKQTGDAARAKRDIAKAGLEHTKAKIAYATLRAPFDGVITERWADPGALLSEGAKLVTVTDDSVLRIRFGIPETEAALVKNGLPVTLAADSLPGKTFETSISRDAGSLDPATRTLPVEADLKNAERLLKPGMFVMARAALEKHENALVIPVDALLTEKKKTSVFKLVDGKARKTSVTVGFNDGLMVELIEGAGENDLLAVFGQTPLTDGQPVKAKTAP